jgi:hypothetical protein
VKIIFENTPVNNVLSYYFQVHDAIDILKEKVVGVYIYISSDAVYEVSIPKSSKRLSKETDAVRHSIYIRAVSCCLLSGLVYGLFGYFSS